MLARFVCTETRSNDEIACEDRIVFVQHISAVRDHLVANGVAVRPAVADDLPSLECGREKYHYDFFVMRDPFGNEILFGG